MSDLELSGKRVLIREDLNVPVDGGKVTSDARIRASLPTIQAALDAGAAVMLMSHLGRRDLLPWALVDGEVHARRLLLGLGRGALHDELRRQPRARQLEVGHANDGHRRQAFISAMVVSSIRLEKPHSLSYHAMTFTQVTSITLVSDAS